MTTAHVPPVRVRHEFVGHINPRCVRCGKTPMEAQKTLTESCQRKPLAATEPPSTDERKSA